MMQRRSGWSKNLLSVFFLGFAGAAQKPITDAGSNLMLRSPDMQFVMRLSQEAVGEVEVGTMAVQKASRDEVKAYGRLMADDYRKISATLAKLVVSRDVTLPQEVPADQLARRTRLQRQTGARFDRRYMRAMVITQKDRIKSFQSEIKKGHDPAIQKFASETLPVLADHLEKARSLYRAITAKRRAASVAEKKP